MLKKTLILCAALAMGALCSPAQALEPLEDRAVVQHMNSDLLLPDGSLLNVDMSFDCGSDFHDTAVLVTNDAGAQLLAAAYTHLYGVEFGQQVMDKWNNKVAESDPRKPTFLVITAPRSQTFDWQQTAPKLSNDTLSSQSLDMSTDSATSSMPGLYGSCGSRDHIPYEL
ncbi:hypothetical protein [Pseudoalteromonas sp. BDTF-M6]|uniref:hypothetical protein n=1 Tax=Pseudoalteromonas sp. BDTF-M6 TaxID=2796132 RepID=UPI001BB017C6|nr:hypothetical protein [Pseudoalteromonas sp. BDTF-M6]MBS3796687.1 hypothetical protein [Pseudoalteromonas sp. BDTF-M6]